MTSLITRRTALVAATGLATTTMMRTPLAWGADKPIVLGCSMPQTGGLAAIGKANLLIMNIWKDEVNAKGGIMGRPVQLVYYDDQSNPANVPGIYTKLLDVDKVDLIVTNGTNLTAPAMPVAMERGQMVLAMFALTVNEKFHYDRYFQTMPYGPLGKESISEGFFDAAASMNPKPTTVALVGADAEFSKAAVEGARDQAKRRGLKIVYDRTYPPSTVDFGPVIRGIASSNPDLVYIGSYPVDSAGLIRAAHELGFKPKLFGGGMVGTQSASLKGDLGDLMNDVVSYELYCPAADAKFPRVKGLLDKYQPLAKTSGVDPLGYYSCPFAYCTMEILQQAVEGIKGTDSEKLAKFMHQATFKTIVGDIKFGEDGEWDRPQMLTVQFRGAQGKGYEQFADPSREVILHPPAFKTGDVHYPMGG